MKAVRNATPEGFRWASRRLIAPIKGLALVCFLTVTAGAAVADGPVRNFVLQEARIAGIHQAMLEKRLTATALVEAYLARIEAYDGACVDEPAGVLGRIQTRRDAGQLNSLLSINLRPAALAAHGFDRRKARTRTAVRDADPAMPDALEVARALDQQLAATGKLTGPLHGIPIVIKDQYDTFDLRTTSGADADYANDRPPRDATVVAKLRAAGAIILAKGNMGEYASGDRSSYGGPQCNAYDTERSAGRSSGGPAAAVAANLAVCAIGEESGPSIRNPARNNNIVGLAPTQGLVSRAGIVPASLFNDRVGPMCRTVEDTARILDVIAGYDAADELTAFSVGRHPQATYESSAQARSLKGLRIGVLREYMDKPALTLADHANIDVVEGELSRLAALGATLVDPGPGKGLFDDCVREYLPATHPRLFVKLAGLSGNDHSHDADADELERLLNLRVGAAPLPRAISLRDIEIEKIPGEGRYALELYLRQRGDASIHDVTQLLKHSRFFTDVRPGSGFSDRRQNLLGQTRERTLGASERAQTRDAVQQIVLQCMARHQLDALTYPTSNIPPPKLGAPVEPQVNGRSPLAWSVLGAYGFPAITVPAGFTTEVYDRIPDDSDSDRSRLVGPVQARLPVGVDFLGRPFAESVLFTIASAYEQSTGHRTSPPQFGQLGAERR